MNNNWFLTKSMSDTDIMIVACSTASFNIIDSTAHDRVYDYFPRAALFETKPMTTKDTYGVVVYDDFRPILFMKPTRVSRVI